MYKPEESPFDSCFIKCRIPSCKEQERKLTDHQKDAKKSTYIVGSYPLKNICVQNRLQHWEK